MIEIAATEAQRAAYARAHIDRALVFRSLMSALLPRMAKRRT